MIRRILLSASLIVAAWPGTASAAWQEASSAHFLVYADDEPERIRSFTERLEKFDKVLRVMRGLKDTPIADADRVRVYMHGDIDSIGKLAGTSGVAGFYESRVGGPVAFVPQAAPAESPYDLDAQTILFHEYTHHFMFTTFPGSVFPEWFVEGYAEFFATAKFQKDGSALVGAVPGYRAWTVSDSSLLPAARLVQLDPGRMTEEQRDALYSRGWLLTHFLHFEPSRDGQLNQYINAINGGQDAGDAATAAFGDLKKLDRDLNAYISRPRLLVSRIPADRLPIGAVTLRNLSPGEAAVMPALLQTTRGVDQTSAQIVVKLARKLAAPFSDDAGAQNELAEAEYDAGNFAEADAAATRAFAVNPQSMHALIYKGMIRVAQLAKAQDTNADHWREARHWFVMANAIDPDNPRPLMLFYTSFLTGGLTPSKNAQDGLITAYQRAPFALGLRVMAADIFLHRDDKESARIALLPVAYSPHGAGTANAALDALGAIDKGDLKQAVAILDRGDEDKPTPAKASGGKS